MTHQHAPFSKTTLVVIEFGGSWPRWLPPAERGDMAVVAQHYESRPSSLITQVASRVTRLEAVGWRLSTAVLVSNGRTDPDASASRCVLARGLVARLRSSGGGTVVLTSSQSAGPRAIRQLTALAASLAESEDIAFIDLCVRDGLGAVVFGENPETLRLASTG
jgi:hypothetical protein